MTPQQFHELLNRIVSGEVSVDTLMHPDSEVDETSVAGNVGSGLERPIGMVRPTLPFQDEKLEKILKEFEDYLKTTNSISTTLEAKRFGSMRRLPESWVQKLVEFARNRK